jgi:peptidoglycan/LPS O-acetylase OafA/YrhL
LRITAAGSVVILHYSDYFKDVAIGQFMVAHTWHFNLFVDLFFVVSGFVIARQYFGGVNDAASIGRFLWRRLARIYPLHLATLAFYIALAGALHFGAARTDNPARYPLSDLPAQFLLLHASIGERLTFNFPSWSLSAEMFCYLLFPAIALIAQRRRREAVIALVVVTALANSLWAWAAGTTPWADWINQGGAFRALPAFSLGMACYLFRDRIARWPAIPGALATSLAAFILLGSWLPTMTALFAVYAIAMLAIQADSAGRETLLSRLRFDRWSPLTYSCYMLHIPVATVIITFGSRLLSLSPHERLMLAPVAIIVLIFASVVSLRTFETPLRRYLTEAYDRRAIRPEPSPAISRQEGT